VCHWRARFIGLRARFEPFDRAEHAHGVAVLVAPSHHDDVANAAREQRAMDPEGIAAGFVATHHRRGGREPEAPPRPRDFRFQCLQRPGRNLPDPRDLPTPRGDGEGPAALAQFERQVEHCVVGRS